MKRSRFSEEQIIGLLKEHEAGVSVADLCRKHGVSDASIYKWKARFGGMDGSEAKRRVALAAWQTDYNETRPHSRLGWQTPSAFAESFPRRDMALRNLTSSASCPVAPTAHPGKSNQPNELRTG